LRQAPHVRLVVASPEPIDVKMGGGQRMEDETLFSANAGMGSQTDDAAVQSCGHRAGWSDGHHDGDATRLAAERKTGGAIHAGQWQNRRSVVER